MNESKPLPVRSAANPRIRHLMRMRDNRNRRKAERVIVDGWRETERALAAGMSLCQQFVPESTDLDQIRAIDRDLDLTTRVTESLMKKIAYGDSHRGVVAEFERPPCELHQLRLPSDPLILVLDRLEKPGNVGAVFRTAEAVGVDAVLLCESADPFNPNAIRNSVGSVFQVPSASGSENELGQFLADHQVTGIAARLESSKPLWELDFQGARAIIVGSEADGLSKRWQSIPPETPSDTDADSPPVTTGAEHRTVESVRIPMAGSGDSLNVSVSVAVICYEAARQRGL